MQGSWSEPPLLCPAGPLMKFDIQCVRQFCMHAHGQPAVDSNRLQGKFANLRDMTTVYGETVGNERKNAGPTSIPIHPLRLKFKKMSVWL